MIRSLMLAAVVLAACTPQDQAAETPAATPPAASTQPTLRDDETLAPDGQITVTSPLSEAKVQSPLVVEGFVLNDWMFEGLLPIRLEVDGVAIAEAPGQQQAPDNWTNPGPVKFRAELVFDVDAETAATLVFQEDTTKFADAPGPARTLRVPVTLLPSAQ